MGQFRKLVENTAHDVDGRAMSLRASQKLLHENGYTFGKPPSSAVIDEYSVKTGAVESRIIIGSFARGWVGMLYRPDGSVVLDEVQEVESLLRGEIDPPKKRWVAVSILRVENGHLITGVECIEIHFTIKKAVHPAKNTRKGPVEMPVVEFDPTLIYSAEEVREAEGSEAGGRLPTLWPGSSAFEIVNALF